MFNKDFYPTPNNIIERMLSGIDFSCVNSVLEPSAGSGNIVEALEKIKKPRYEHGNPRYSFDIDCVEIDRDLQSILKGKGFRVVHDDFLTFETMKEYDLIIANFPFSNGVKHMLKAIEMQKRNGGGIVCLLNAETIKNPCSNGKMRLKRELEESGAEIQYIQDAFVDAERKTNVEVALIKMKLEEPKRESIIIGNLKRMEHIKEYDDSECNTLVDSDFFKAIVSQYNMEIKAGIDLINEYRAMRPFILSSFEKDKETGKTVQAGGCILNLDMSNNHNSYRNTLSINNYIREVRGKYWEALFHNEKFIGQLTDNLRRDFYNRIEELKDYDFSLYNIYELKIEMQNKVAKGIEETIVDLFEELGNRYHYYDETSNNIHYYNGWKTNKSWIINKKVIIPLNAFSQYSGEFSMDYNAKGKLADIEKCLNYLDGGLTTAVDLESTLKMAVENKQTRNIKLKYFNVTFYKKGTCHITFTNGELLKKLNIFGSQHKGWLPPGYGKTKYEDMSEEGKKVIDGFEGRNEYIKVLSNAKYYLSYSSGINLIGCCG